jgi:predicted anti-sigma-YlaC factor YlaD
VHSCREITELASQYLDGELGLGTRVLVRMHLLACRHCRRFVEQLRRTIELTRQVPTELGPPELEERLITAFRKRAAMADKQSPREGS